MTDSVGPPGLNAARCLAPVAHATGKHSVSPPGLVAMQLDSIEDIARIIFNAMVFQHCKVLVFKTAL
ncbi:hypothetical protein TBK1r_18770 [Stieleria magnilauensis]|uniref:Uncharacterized protein n=1 Tax=Stieleria magnilauensis TaxID=2527963 RepID=A0ABX5XPP4_9BACT|nr:hypothetical protein TBK1r_18770 [Planctomycetes bacterium TBK1r]